MSHPDPCYDPDNSYEDDDMVVEHDPSDALLAEYLYDNKEDIYMDNDTNYDDYNDFNEMVEDGADDFWYDEADDSMDGDHDSAMRDAGFGTDEDYGYYGDDTPMYDDYYGGE
jgi:hypothetical protein